MAHETKLQVEPGSVPAPDEVWDHPATAALHHEFRRARASLASLSRDAEAISDKIAELDSKIIVPATLEYRDELAALREQMEKTSKAAAEASETAREVGKKYISMLPGINGAMEGAQ